MYNRSTRYLSACSIAILLSAANISAAFAAPASVQGPAWAQYNQFCVGCHGMSKHGKSAASIRTAINNTVSMIALKSLAAGQISDIAAGK